MKPTPKDSDIEQLTLTEFLLARIAEDEEVARATTGGDRTGNWWLDPDEGGVTEVSCLDVQGFVYAVDVDAAHIARHDPASVLAECEAKRRIVWRLAQSERLVEANAEAHSKASRQRPLDQAQIAALRTHGRELSGRRDGLLYAATELAAVYADHPDYREEWKP